jgi:hypothetical protein
MNQKKFFEMDIKKAAAGLEIKAENKISENKKRACTERKKAVILKS